MINKIQKYLLLNHPMLWNIRLVPMALILLGAHIIFFSIGYFSADTAFDRYAYYYSAFDQLGLLYFVSMLIGVLILIGWLVFYNRNNSFKNFYPRKTTSIFLEWVLIFSITAGIAFLPASLTYGNYTNWRSVSSLKEARAALDLLNKVKVLIPTDNSSYSYDSDYFKPIDIPKNNAPRIDTLDLDLYSLDYNEDGGILLRGYVGPSLLFYSSYEYSYVQDDGYSSYEDSTTIDEYKNKVQQIEIVKQWLAEGKKDSITMIMTQFFELQAKHNLSANLTPNEWFKRIYNPPYFPVDQNNTIGSSSDDDYYYDDYGDYQKMPHLSYEELSNGYEQIIKTYDNNDESRMVTLVCFCLACIVSIFIFSFRVTTGRSWIIAFVACGVMIFVSSLISVGLASAAYYEGAVFGTMMCLFWITIFMILMINLILKTANSGNKGRSNILINVFLWLLPFVIPFMFFGYNSFLDLLDHEYMSVESESIELMFWLNIVFTVIIVMPVSIFIRRWKSLPEE